MNSADAFYGKAEFWNGTSFGFMRPDRGVRLRDRTGPDIRLPDLREEIAQCQCHGQTHVPGFVHKLCDLWAISGPVPVYRHNKSACPNCNIREDSQ
jgi:hypothetical protein